MKVTARNLLAHTCRVSGLLGHAERIARTQLNILCYHRILPAAEKFSYFCPDLVVTPESFRSHCQTLSKFYQVLPLADAVVALRAGPQEKPLVAITFDDGYADNFFFAAPILKEFYLKATFFVVSGQVGATTPPWYDIAARCVQDLKKLGEATMANGEKSYSEKSSLSSIAFVQQAKTCSHQERKILMGRICARLGSMPIFSSQDRIMTAEQLRTLAAEGHEIGSHSVSHEILPMLDANSLEQEILHSKVQLEQALRAPLSSFCYPNGDFDARCLKSTDSAGYIQAVTTLTGSNACDADPFTLKRHFVHEQRLSNFHGKPSTTLFRAEACGLANRLLRRSSREVATS